MLFTPNSLTPARPGINLRQRIPRNPRTRPSLTHTTPLTNGTQPPILVNRFMINLRATARAPSASLDASRVVSQANFLHIPDSILGNIGEPLARGDEDERGAEGAESRAAGDLAGSGEWRSPTEGGVDSLAGGSTVGDESWR